MVSRNIGEDVILNDAQTLTISFSKTVKLPGVRDGERNYKVGRMTGGFYISVPIKQVGPVAEITFEEVDLSGSEVCVPYSSVTLLLILLRFF